MQADVKQETFVIATVHRADGTSEYLGVLRPESKLARLKRLVSRKERHGNR